MLNKIIPTEILNIIILNNSIEKYLESLVYFILAIIILGFLQKFILDKFEKISKKTENDIDDMVFEVISGIRPRFYLLLSIFLSTKTLILPSIISKSISSLFILIIIFQLTKSLKLIIDFIVNKFNGEEEDKENNRNISNLLSSIAVFFTWIIGILTILSNIGVNVTSLLAGIGIGGAAFALALRDVLSDLFASISIYFDKPFRIGDSISVGEQSGVVERIGLKTTRIRASKDEEIVISNKDLTSARLHNFHKLDKSRVEFNIKVNNSTPFDKLKLVNEIITKIIKNIEKVELSSCNFKSIEGGANIFKIVIMIKSEVDSKAVIMEKINFQICDRFEKEGILLV